MSRYKPKWLGSRLYPQIEVYNIPTFYHELSYNLYKHNDVKVHLPIYIVEWAPQIIEIECGLMKSINYLIKLWNNEKQKPHIKIRTKRGRIIPLLEETKDIIKEWAEKEETKTSKNV